MTKQHERIWRMLKDLDYLFTAIGKTEDKLEILRDCANDMAESLKEFMDEEELDYTAALDRVLNISRGKSYKSMVWVFGLTPGEIERKKQREKPRILQPGDWVTHD